MTDEYHSIVCLPGTAGPQGAATTIVRLAGEFDLATCDELRRTLAGAVNAEGSTHLVVDLSSVEFLDSETVVVLAEGYTLAQLQGRDYRLSGVQGIALRVLDILGWSHLVEMPDRGSPLAWWSAWLSERGSHRLA